MSDATGRKTLWALCDQGVVSAGNFLTNLILIRQLSAEEFGAFALLLNAMLFLNNIHASTITYTILIRGAQAEDDRGACKVASGGIWATMALTLFNTIGLFFAASYVAHRELLLFVVLASLCWQVQEALRTVFVARLSYKRALPGDITSYLGQAAVIGALCYFGKPSLLSLFVAMMFTSLAGALIQAGQIRPTAIDWDWMRSFRKEIWLLGRWSVMAKLVAFFCLQAFPWVLAYRHGIATVAAFSSLFQLVALTNPILLSANNLIMASIAKNRRMNVPFVPNALKYILYTSVIVGSYFAILLFGGVRLMAFFYGKHSIYLSNAPLLRIFIAAYVLEFCSMFAGGILAGMEKTQPLFIQQLWGMGIAICFVLPWVAHSGLFAAVTGLLIVNATKAAAGWYMVYSARRESRGLSKANAVLATL